MKLKQSIRLYKDKILNTTKRKARAKNVKKDKNKKKNAEFLKKKSLISRIRTGEDPILREVCSDVKKGEPISHIVEEMKAVLLSSKNGVGLSASQIGYPKKIFIAKSCSPPYDIKAYINATIVKESTEMETMIEGCLSYPGVYKKIERPSSITIEYNDEELRAHNLELHGMDARIICHEIDHTSGVCRVHQ